MNDSRFLHVLPDVYSGPPTLATTGLEALPVFIIAFAVIIVGVGIVLYLGHRRRRDRGA